MNNDDLYKNLLDNLSEGIHVVDQEGVISSWNKSAEMLTGYKSSEIVGQCCRGDVLNYVDDQGVSVCGEECLAVKSMNDGCIYSMEVYVNHKEGHRVPILVRVSPIKNSQGQVIGAVEELCDNASKSAYEHKIEELEKCALVDPLTGLMKKRGLEMNLRSVIGVMHRYGWTYGVIYVDIDEFERINEMYGRTIGNDVLKMIAKTLQNSVRATDVVGRWEDDVFMIIAANVNEDQLIHIANKIRVLVEQSGFSVESGIIRVTASVCATVVRSNDTVSALFERIDKLMEHGKVFRKKHVLLKMAV
ncbi:MAG: sensor domain-containing diguanylate cyclase [Candidatus Brocadiaceae bacterium]|uniref:diguanylate cyclase n=1 Tax=Candidatus Wunengus sp. YC61 TaxID=3367698 RepID=UPI002722E1D0|nr:sensor domain-containing diguanylate cyclase [Candidatus Brocadiaceae bacterium]